jgi:hypothetical protein
MVFFLWNHPMTPMNPFLNTGSPQLSTFLLPSLISSSGYAWKQRDKGHSYSYNLSTCSAQGFCIERKPRVVHRSSGRLSLTGEGGYL